VTYVRDPVSVLFDAGARSLLTRAYAARGTWVSTRLADPSPRHLAQLALLGINPLGPDGATAAGGRGLDARTRWARGFVRALYYQHRWYAPGTGDRWRQARRTVPGGRGALEVQVGPRLRVRGVLPGGREVRVRVHPGGQAARRAAARLPDSRRIYDDQWAPGERWSDPALRDW
jgi:hypothetical protein